MSAASKRERTQRRSPRKSWRRSGRVLVAPLLLLLAIGAACSREGSSVGPGSGGRSADDRGSSENAATFPPVSPPELPPAVSPSEALRSVVPVACTERIAAVLREPAWSGAAELEARRIEIFLRAKGEPVLFLREPVRAREVSPKVRTYQHLLDNSPRPRGVLAQLLNELAGDRETLRAVLLREGYLYTERPRLAEALSAWVRADLLFHEPRVWIQRGEQTIHARFDAAARRYVHEEGSRRGQAVRVLLFDRLGAGDGPTEAALHLDVRALRYRHGFERLQVRHLTQRWLVADLLYGSLWITHLFSIDSPRVERVCDAEPPGRAAEASSLRQEGKTRARALSALQRAIREQAADELPFDEPRTELGQQDGELRSEWREAYQRGELVYVYNEDEYPVFGVRGQPLVPQVCTDFLLDTLERASGTWWLPQGQPPGRTPGRFDVRSLLGEDRDELRRVTGFVAFAREHPEWFDVLEIPANQRVPMRLSGGFARFLESRRHEFQPADMVLIGGYVPWDPRRYVHYHSFWVFDSDPVTGMPLLIAGNPGRPRITPFISEMRRTPKRSVYYRVRPRTRFLSDIVLGSAEDPVLPPSLEQP